MFYKEISIKIYNSKGQFVNKLIVDHNKSSIEWDCSDVNGKRVTSGIYFYKLLMENY